MTELSFVIVTYMDVKGQRVSTETAYLSPAVLARPNLTVATHAVVTRILFKPSPSTSGEPRAIGVEFASSKEGRAGRRRVVKARQEVVVWYKIHPYSVYSRLTRLFSGGAVHTPQV